MIFLYVITQAGNLKEAVMEGERERKIHIQNGERLCHLGYPIGPSDIEQKLVLYKK